MYVLFIYHLLPNISWPLKGATPPVSGLKCCDVCGYAYIYMQTVHKSKDQSDFDKNQNFDGYVTG